MTSPAGQYGASFRLDAKNGRNTTRSLAHTEARSRSTGPWAWLGRPSAERDRMVPRTPRDHAQAIDTAGSHRVAGPTRSTAGQACTAWATPTTTWRPPSGQLHQTAVDLSVKPDTLSASVRFDHSAPLPARRHSPRTVSWRNAVDIYTQLGHPTLPRCERNSPNHLSPRGSYARTTERREGRCEPQRLTTSGQIPATKHVLWSILRSPKDTLSQGGLDPPSFTDDFDTPHPNRPDAVTFSAASLSSSRPRRGALSSRMTTPRATCWWRAVRPRRPPVIQLGLAAGGRRGARFSSPDTARQPGPGPRIGGDRYRSARRPEPAHARRLVVLVAAFGRTAPDPDGNFVVSHKDRNGCSGLGA